MKRYLFMLIFIVKSLCGETIFLKENGSPLTADEHAVVYTIMLETQFPMSLAHGTYVDDEIGEMNKKIEQQLPNSGISAHFIPTTLYELFALKLIQDNCHKDPATNIDPLAIATGQVLVINEPFENHKNEQCFYIDANVEFALNARGDNQALTISNVVQGVNNDQRIRAWHHTLNTAIVDQLREKKLSMPNDALKALEAINFWQSNRCIYQEICGMAVDKDIARKAVECDLDAFAKKQFTLYRGTEVLDFNAYGNIGSDITRSISFGSSLFAGILKDAQACAYYYITNPGLTGYALFIGKKEYAQGELSNLFYIPAVVTLGGMIGAETSFHARSKIALGGASIAGDVMRAESDAHARALYSKMLLYIKENHRVIKEPSEALQTIVGGENDVLLEVLTIIKNNNKKRFAEVGDFVKQIGKDADSLESLYSIAETILKYERTSLYPLVAADLFPLFKQNPDMVERFGMDILDVVEFHPLLKEIMDILKETPTGPVNIISSILLSSVTELYGLIEKFIRESKRIGPLVYACSSIIRDPGNIFRRDVIEKVLSLSKQTKMDWNDIGEMSHRYAPEFGPLIRKFFYSYDFSQFDSWQAGRIVADIVVNHVEGLYDLVDFTAKRLTSVELLERIADAIRSSQVPELQPVLGVIDQRIKELSSQKAFVSMLNSAGETIIEALCEPPFYMQWILRVTA